MPTFFIVSTPTETPVLSISQASLEQVQQNIRGLHSSCRHFIHDLRPLASESDHLPKGHARLAMVAIIEPDDECEYYRGLLFHAISRLPTEQQKEEVQKAIDSISKHLKGEYNESKYTEPERVGGSRPLNRVDSEGIETLTSLPTEGVRPVDNASPPNSGGGGSIQSQPGESEPTNPIPD